MKLSNSQRASLEHATAAYQSHVQAVLPYLSHRGIEPATAAMFRLGYVATPDVGHEQMQGRLAIPYLTPAGVIDIRFRALTDEQHPKYLSRPGASTHVFGVRAFAIESDVIVVTEGELDAVIVNQCGVPAVGLPGAKNWKAHYSRLFQDYRQVVALVDGDPAGRDLGKTLARELENALVVEMPEGMDVTDIYMNEGKDGVLRRAGL